MSPTSFSPASAPDPRPKQWEKWVLYAYLRMLGTTQKDAATAVGRQKRTCQEWEEHRTLYAAAKEEAKQRWLGDVIDTARGTLLKSLREGNAELALKILERVDPALAPPAQRLKHEGQVDLVAHPAWLALRMQILQVLAPYPEARAQLAEVLTDGNGTGH
jgi:hypothetical protein